MGSCYRKISLCWQLMLLAAVNVNIIILHQCNKVLQARKVPRVVPDFVAWGVLFVETTPLYWTHVICVPNSLVLLFHLRLLFTQAPKPVPEAVKQGVESVGKDVGALPGQRPTCT